MNGSTERIWLIGGTREGRELAIALGQHHIPCTVSVATAAARTAYPTQACLRVIVGGLNPSTVQPFLVREQIMAIVDASHPFAVEISQLAMAAAAQHHLPYLRYERPPCMNSDAGHDPQVLAVDSLATLLRGEVLCNQQVLLTLGYKALAHFQAWHQRCTLFARILPSPVALQAALAAGFSSDRLMALRPPVPMEIERALWQHWRISMVVTKASGSAGGEAIKRQVATMLGVNLVIIQRPPMIYPQQTGSMAEVLHFCVQILELGNQAGHVKTD